MNHDVALIATHIAPARGFGGVAESAAALARAWRRRDRSFIVAASDGSMGRPIGIADPGLAAPVGSRLYRAHWNVRWGFGLGAPTALWTVCRSARAVYICGIATWPTTLAALFCRLLGRPYVVAPRGGLMPDHTDLIRRERPLKWLYYRLLVFPALRHARAVHSTSDPERDGVLALLPGLRVEVVPNGVDIDFWRCPPSARTEGAGTRFCYIGRLSREKGILRFLELWLRCRGPNDRLSILGGGDGPYADSVRRLALSAGPAVIMAGQGGREEVRRVLAESDFAALPSGLDAGGLRENFGNAAAEALAAGRPVLARRGLAWDGLARTGAGILFEGSDESVMAAIREAAGLGDDAYAAMAEAARRYAERVLEAGSVADRLWDIVTTPPPGAA